MSDDQQVQQAAEQRRRLGLPANLDPRHLDPRKALDPAALERVLKAQAAARAQATAATTVLIGTVITLISSAFAFVAALAWNDAITKGLDRFVATFFPKLAGAGARLALIHAVVVTVIAVVAVVILNRIASRWVKKSAIAGQNELL
ncbi:MAG: hypothetical protein OJF49_004344 [Ktedonobacterales bacterium]|jgi:hypothetical protein|nr:MAG: hypothetical protein OJF49_004344 [Ktedonobacterales bacterium]